MTRRYNRACAESDSQGYHRGGRPYDTPAQFPGAGRSYSTTLSRTQAAILASQKSQQDIEYDEEKRRKRIPVACTRCRQRKIKCSGPASPDGSCEACHSAGNEDCSFDRVNSKVMPFKQDVDTAYPYDFGAAHAAQSRIYSSTPAMPYSSVHASYTNDPSFMCSTTYRSGPPSEPYASTDYTGSFGSDSEYSVDGQNFSVNKQPYTIMSQEQMSIPSVYNSQAQSRGWVQLPAARPEQGQWQSHGVQSNGYALPMQYTHPLYSVRSAMPGESSNFGNANIASSLPPPTRVVGTNMARMLPAPAMHTPVPYHHRQSNAESGLLSLSRSAETMSYTPLPSSATTQNGSMHEHSNLDLSDARYGNSIGSQHIPSIYTHSGSIPATHHYNTPVEVSSAYGQQPTSETPTDHAVQYTPQTSTSPTDSQFAHVQQHNLAPTPRSQSSYEQIGNNIIPTLRSQHSAHILRSHASSEQMPATMCDTDVAYYDHQSHQLMGRNSNANISSGSNKTYDRSSCTDHDISGVQLSNAQTYQPLSYAELDDNDMERRGSRMLANERETGLGAGNLGKDGMVKTRGSATNLRA